jgi:LmbE family N-acetylglucosaminyl deacetylase
MANRGRQDGATIERFPRYNQGMNWIYLSPHFDDVALSCGGLVWEQVQAGNPVCIWTICAGEPPAGALSPFAQELHARWETGPAAPLQRRTEDLASCQRLGASQRYFSVPDCIYRRDPQTGEFLYASEGALSGALHPGDAGLITVLREELGRTLQAGVAIVCPLALGNHVDHQLTRLAAEGLDCTLWYYADYPYVLRCKTQVEAMEQEGWKTKVFPISGEVLNAWQDSVAAHGSQISTFWAGENEMRLAISEYMQWNKGMRLWRKPGSSKKHKTREARKGESHLQS